MIEQPGMSFASGDFYPQGYCYLWNGGLVWLHLVSDFLIALSYFAIPILLVWFIRKRRDLPFRWMFALFGLFVAACGATHLMEVWNLWHAQYWLAGAIKALTAAASLPTVVLLAQIVPQALELPSTTDWIRAKVALEGEVRERRELETNLRLSEARYRDLAELLELTHDAILVRDLRGGVTFWNRGAERLYGWQRDEILGKSGELVRELLHTELPQSLAELESQVLQHGSWEGEVVEQRRDSSKVIVASRWALRSNAAGTPIAMLISNRDITRRKQEELKFRNLLEAAPDATVIVDHAGLMQLVNTQAEKLFGYARQELLGQPVELLIPRRFHSQHNSHRRDYTEQPQVRSIEASRALIGLRKDGSEFPVEIGLSPIDTAGGVLIASSIRDISHRKEIEAQFRAHEDRFRLLVSGVTDYAIFMLDLAGNVVSWNAGAERIKGYTSEEILGQHFSCFYSADAQSAGKPASELKVAAERGRGEDEGWRVRKDGSRFWANVVITALLDESGKLQGYSKVTRDMTERKEIEEKLEEQSRQLARTNLELVETNKELESFSYSVSHDLRAPLRAIDGFSHALLEDCGDKLDAAGKDYLHRIRAATQRMGMLIDDLLNLSRITRGEMHRENIDLSALVLTIAAGLEKTQQGRTVQFKIEKGLSVKADQSLLRAALENLLGNAWKFTSKLPVAHIEFGCTASNGFPVYFVRDDGAGFDPAFADRLFGAFQRLHAVSEFPGTGVGLATVQRILRRHGGHIWAEGEVGKGATFFFTLEGPLG